MVGQKEWNSVALLVDRKVEMKGNWSVDHSVASMVGWRVHYLVVLTAGLSGHCLVDSKESHLVEK